MFTKMKIAIVVSCSLLAGVAMAQPTDTQKQEKRAELKAKRQAKHQEMILKFDTNKDGKLDDAERAVKRDTMMTTAFQRLDVDGNGQISLAEFKTGKQKLRHHRMGKMGKRGFGKRGMRRGLNGQ